MKIQFPKPKKKKSFFDLNHANGELKQKQQQQYKNVCKKQNVASQEKQSAQIKRKVLRSPKTKKRVQEKQINRKPDHIHLYINIYKHIYITTIKVT